MTVISKSFDEKKSDTINQPLVEDGKDVPEKKDVEANKVIPSNVRRLYLLPTTRGRSFHTLTLIMLLVLILIMCMFGLFGSFFQHYRYIFNYDGEDENAFRAWGTIAYEDEVQAALHQDEREIEDTMDEDMTILSRIMEELAYLNGKKPTELAEATTSHKNELKEEFELDLTEDKYEKISIPSEGNNRFVYDFGANLTAIVNAENRRCFIMPLNRSLVLAPSSLHDLIFKMANGYYSVDTEKVREDMHVLLPPLDPETDLGVYIGQECGNFTTYRLEKASSTIVKRSVDSGNQESFTVFAGKMVEVKIHGIPDL